MWNNYSPLKSYYRDSISKGGLIYVGILLDSKSKGIDILLIKIPLYMLYIKGLIYVGILFVSKSKWIDILLIKKSLYTYNV